MNSVSEVSDLVIRRFNRLYGPPTTPDRDAYFAEYFKALKGTDPKLLEEAVDVLVKRQTIPAWPTVGACVEAVHEVAESRMSEQRRHVPQQEDYPEPTPEERARVRALLADLQTKLAANSRGRATQPREDWSRASMDAWDERMATSETARELSLPRDLRRR
jgi:hypothetical protein